MQDANRKAFFQTMICYKDCQTAKVFKGIWKGEITPKMSEMYNPDWQYNSIFIPAGFKKPLSEVPLESRAKKSHRKKAFDQFIKYWRKEK